jgi:hypothetical protein
MLVPAERPRHGRDHHLRAGEAAAAGLLAGFPAREEGERRSRCAEGWIERVREDDAACSGRASPGGEGCPDAPSRNFYLLSPCTDRIRVCNSL